MDWVNSQSISLNNIINEKAFLEFVNLMPHAVFIAVNGVNVYCNNSCASLLGLSDPKEMAGRCIKEFIHPSYLLDFKKLKNAMTGQNNNCSILETKIVKKDGAIIDADITAREFDDNGNKVTYLIIKDITESNKIKKSLIESEEKYRTLVEMLPDAILVRNKERILYANKAATRILGCKDSEEIIGRRITEFISPYPKGKFSIENFDRELFENGYVPYREYDYSRKSDGKILMMETGVKAIANGEEPLYLVISRDISERKQSEELKKEMESRTKELLEAVGYDRLRTEFFANISHEFRTPLNVILSALQLSRVVLKDAPAGECKEKVTKYNNLMQQNCYRLIKLVNNLIDITRIDTGYFSILPQECNIVSIIEDITLSVKSYIENKGLDLTFDTEEEEIMLLCDPEKIERIILNLLSNALKFTNSPGHIMVSMRKKDEKVLVSVKDTGIGIPEDKEALIFDRFRQVDKSLSRNNEGSGIGLSLVKSLVEMHGGRISVKSIYREGSEFIIELPINNSLHLKASESKNFFHQSNLEKISIEFSDIYF